MGKAPDTDASGVGGPPPVGLDDAPERVPLDDSMFRPAADDPYLPDDAPVELVDVAPRQPSSPATVPPSVEPTPEPPPSLPETARNLVVDGSMGGLGVLLSIPLSLLPEETRKRVTPAGVPLAMGTALSAAIQMVAVFVIGAARYPAYQESLAPAMMDHAGRNGLDVTAITGFGGLALISYVFFTVTGWLLFYFFTEGVVRATSGLVVRTPLGTLPAFVAELAVGAGHRLLARWRQPPLCEDRVWRDGGAVYIASCRPNEWQAHTISVDGELFSFDNVERRDDPSRPWVHRLVPHPPNVIVRKLVQYDPNAHGAKSRADTPAGSG